MPGRIRNAEHSRNRWIEKSPIQKFFWIGLSIVSQKVVSEP
ncbi:hypothetical protein D3OALGA1CA_4274 [Olavius algarvensis associated proteobacterium Delta 3]|nr:hypothetical protein D3OALGB2SA_84 [Olavius algarvensis associated proteobacterium Delta 3]CAB5148321.1 hypothetical protein D3OALGA1CA_4274 [Olavius algarvensis associated proteobacterium Delta 3]